MKYASCTRDAIDRIEKQITSQAKIQSNNDLLATPPLSCGRAPANASVNPSKGNQPDSLTTQAPGYGPALLNTSVNPPYRAPPRENQQEGPGYENTPNVDQVLPPHTPQGPSNTPERHRSPPDIPTIRC